MLHFGRLLRQKGIPVSSQQIYELIYCLTYIDISRRDDFYTTTRAFLLHDIDKLEWFNLIFDSFWSRQIEFMAEYGVSKKKSNLQKESILKGDEQIMDEKSHLQLEDDADQPGDQPEDTQINPTYSPIEVLCRKDFADLNQEELDLARQIILNMVLNLGLKPTRRKVRSIKQAAQLDFRRVMRKSMNYDGEILKLSWRKRKLKFRKLVVICDISGSMERYSKLFLYFLYALTHQSQKVEIFVFATRLTRLTPILRHRSIDEMVDNLSSTIYDWASGTRIGASLREFNYHWSRRVLRGGAITIVISDGWDRGDGDLLRNEISRLRRSIHRLIWLNPLSGRADYQPLVQGIQIARPFVDDFLPLTNLENLSQLAEKLGALGGA